MERNDGKKWGAPGGVPSLHVRLLTGAAGRMGRIE